MFKRKILIVEDEFFIADDCAQRVREMGHEVVGPFSNVEDGFASLSQIDGALLDINLAGKSVYTLLDEVLKLRIPVAVYTGYSQVPAKYADVACFHKPYDCSRAVNHVCAPGLE